MKERNILFCLDFMTEERKKKAEKVCEAYGFTPLFYNNGEKEEAIKAVRDCEVLYASSRELLKAAGPKLKWFCCSFAGVDPFIKDPDLFPNPDCILTNSNCYGVAIADHVIMVALMLLKRMPEYLEIIRNREWINKLKTGTIRGATVTIIGTGNVGQNVAERMRGMAAGHIIGVNRTGRAVRTYFDEVHPIGELEAVLPRTDLLVMAVPATPETDRILNRKTLALLPEESYVINVGRGNAVDQDALMEALNSGRLAGAAIDVMEPEPLPKDHPLWTTRNLIITPHFSGNLTLEYTCDTNLDMFLADLARYAKGEPLQGLVDRKLGY